MSDFRKYDSVERYNKQEVDGILNGKVWITEKIDGANSSVYYDEVNGLTITSRNRILYTEKQGIIDGFRGLVDYVLANPSIKQLVSTQEYYILYGEWNVHHTITYPIDSQKQIYFFDIFNKINGTYLSPEKSYKIFETFKLKTAPILAVLDSPTLEQCKEYMNVNKMKASPQQEGIVIKNPSFLNVYGRPTHAKIVNEQFKEQNKEIFGKRSKCCHWNVEDKIPTIDPKNPNASTPITSAYCTKCGKQCEVEIYEPPKKIDIEEKIALQYITKNRVEKIINKTSEVIDSVGDYLIDYKVITEKDIPQILNRTYNDLIKEEMWEILKEFKNPVIDFKKLQKHCNNLTKKYFFEYLEVSNAKM